MNKLEKLKSLIVIDNSDYYTQADLARIINDLIDHIAALESEVDRLKGHRHKAVQPTNHPNVTRTTLTTPPIMETDKQ